MPVSRKRRPRRNTAQRASARPRDLTPWMEALVATDAAEARGCADEALWAMEAVEVGPDGKPWWRPWRRTRLQQLARWSDLAPAWVFSRWICAQAAQSLDPSAATRSRRALAEAIRLRGGTDVLPGVDPIDARCKVIDHDWVYRQLVLYDFGGLRAYLRGASPDLIARADLILQWCVTRMGGYRLVEMRGRQLVWDDLRDGHRVTMADIGSGCWVEPGECVIGRIVPVSGGVLFESTPLPVPDEVAQEVAGNPDEWVTALEAACHRYGVRPHRAEDPAAPDVEAIRVADLFDFGVLTDVPRGLWQAVTADARGIPSAGVVDDGVSLLTMVLGDLVGERELPDFLPPLVGAALLEPEVYDAVRTALAPDVADLVDQLATRLAEPAASVCRGLAREIAGTVARSPQS